MAYREGERIVFLHIFAKSQLDNISPDVQAYWRRFAGEILALTDTELKSATVFGEMQEIWYDA